MSESESLQDLNSTSETSAGAYPMSQRAAGSSAMVVEGELRVPNGAGIHGLTVELVDDDFELVERLQSTVTNIDGRFSLTYDPANYWDFVRGSTTGCAPDS
jgi:hypothetical protein